MDDTYHEELNDALKKVYGEKVIRNTTQKFIEAWSHELGALMKKKNKLRRALPKHKRKGKMYNEYTTLCKKITKWRSNFLKKD